MSYKRAQRIGVCAVLVVTLVVAALLLTALSSEYGWLSIPFLGIAVIAVLALVLGVTALNSLRVQKDFVPESLKKVLEAQEQSARLLIRRDLELNKANERLRELDERKSEFLSIVAHQLRTPLSGIKWTFNMILSGDLGPMNESQRTFLMKGNESNQRMIMLVEDMLMADRVGSGKYSYTFVSTQLLDLFDNVLYEILPLANKKSIKLVFTKGDIPKVSIDPEKIRAVLQNLLENAVKYSHVGGKVNISLSTKDGLVKVAISDEGIGIPLDQQKNIFNRFYRAPNAIKLQTDGSGLGLFIVKGIVERHGGTVWFDSSENKGSTFYFTVKAG